MIVRDNNWIEIARELQYTQSKLKFLKEKKASMLYSRPGTVDYKLIPELEDINLDEYRKKEQKYWKLSYTEQFNI